QRGEAAEIVLAEAPVIAVERPRLPRPGPGHAEVPVDVAAVDHPALLVEERQIDAVEGQGRRARLAGGDAGEGGDHHPAGLRLPPGVDNGALALADLFMEPPPHLGADGLARGAEHAQRLAAGALEDRVP